MKCTIGLDFGTNSVRALLVDVQTGEEIATSVHEYQRGTRGVIEDKENIYLARQHPADYIDGLDGVVLQLLKRARDVKGFSADDIIGIGVDATASSPLPVDEKGTPLAFDERFANNANAMAWLWKDHTAHREADEFMEIVTKKQLPYLDSYGGIYSAEWFWSKLYHCCRMDQEVAYAAASWIEKSDFIPAFLIGNASLKTLPRGSCAAGYKGMYDLSYGGYPPADFFKQLNTYLAKIRESLPLEVYAPGKKIGTLSEKLQREWGLGERVAVSAGIIDAHAGAIGSGIRSGVLVKIIGTSTCDMALLPTERGITAIPGISGVVKDGIVPGYYGVEAGQAAVGDIVNWYVKNQQFGSEYSEERLHEELTDRARQLQAGESGLLALDWHNGNRNVLMDPQLSGLIIGYTLQTAPQEIYRTLIESTGFGARAIIDRLKEYGVPVDEIICCGGIAEKNDLFMKIYANIMNQPIKIARSLQAPAFGAAICAAVAAGKTAGGYDTFTDAIERMTGVKSTVFTPNPEAVKIYDKLYELYMKLHNIYGTKDERDNLFSVMKKLIEIRESVVKE